MVDLIKDLAREGRCSEREAKEILLNMLDLSLEKPEDQNAHLEAVLDDLGFEIDYMIPLCFFYCDEREKYLAEKKV